MAMTDFEKNYNRATVCLYRVSAQTIFKQLREFYALHELSSSSLKTSQVNGFCMLCK